MYYVSTRIRSWFVSYVFSECDEHLNVVAIYVSDYAVSDTR